MVRPGSLMNPRDLSVSASQHRDCGHMPAQFLFVLLIFFSYMGTRNQIQVFMPEQHLID